MDRTKPFKSIREREQKILGIYSFSDPLVQGQNKATTQTTRRAQVFRAQQKHRARTQEYMAALESEIQRLREEAADLLQTSNNWKRSTLALIGPSRNAGSDYWESFLDPGVFFWAVTDVPGSDSNLSENSFSWLQVSPKIVAHPSYTTIPRTLETYDSTTRELLLNFCLHITPTLDVNQGAIHGYTEHVMPLALESDMVRNALLAASASQLQSKQSSMAVLSLKYRSAAINELQRASKQLQADGTSALATLATILGLLIDDMMKGSKDFSMLMKLADSWIVLNPPSDNHNPSHGYGTLRKFLLDQIQMLKTLVHPLHMFNQSHSPTKKIPGSSSSSDMPNSYTNIHAIFSNIQHAVAQACTLFNARPRNGVWTNNPNTISADIGSLLDGIQSTVIHIPPFSLGENTLVWVYSVAASRSASPRHFAFFTSRLAELLSRTGHQDIPGYLSKLSLPSDSNDNKN